MLLRQTEQRTGIVRQFAACFRDHRQPEQVEHSVRELVSQRVYGLALGYEDLNDHDQLRSDPLLALLSGKQDLAGKRRRRRRDRGKAGAGKSTLNRLERTPVDAGAQSRYKKIVLDTSAVDRLLTSLYVQSQPRQPERIVLDLDGRPAAGHQEGVTTDTIATCRSTFSPGSSCYCGRSTPRRGRSKRSSGVEQLRQVWPEAEILLRADSGFCRDEISGARRTRRLRHRTAQERPFVAPHQKG